MVEGLCLMACVASGCRCFFYLVGGEVGEQASDSSDYLLFWYRYDVLVHYFHVFIYESGSL